ncbi:MAG: SO_0444 family Cu/Zn efflux transporter [Sulfurimonas sp.]|nr:SO_0444 family Cu/Zn efflux transporter [Sulfurimonas sp.]
MEVITLFFTALIELSNAMSIYILFGLIFAGVLHELVPDSIVTKHLGNENIVSVIKATIFGIPLPVCSCGVIPLATSIKKSGASKGATLSFLISTPITGVDSILATFGMFGWIFTIYRVVTSMLISMIAGILANILDKEVITDEEESKSCCSLSKTPHTHNEQKPKFSFIKATRYAFITLLGDISKPLFWGLLLGALITIAIPQNLNDILTQYSWISYLIVITIAVPMYVCATASLPIAAALMLSGVSAGAAFVFLSAGPATNTVTIGVVKKMLGTKSLYIYLGSIIFGSILFGLGLDFIFDINEIDSKSLIHLHEESGILEILSSIILWALILFFILRPYFKTIKTNN